MVIPRITEYDRSSKLKNILKYSQLLNADSAAHKKHENTWLTSSVIRDIKYQELKFKHNR